MNIFKKKKEPKRRHLKTTLYLQEPEETLECHFYESEEGDPAKVRWGDGSVMVFGYDKAFVVPVKRVMKTETEVVNY